MNIANIGSTGNVGRKTIEILENKIKIRRNLFSSIIKKCWKKIKFRNKNIKVESLANYDFSRAKITIFAAGSQIAKEWVQKHPKKQLLLTN